MMVLCGFNRMSFLQPFLLPQEMGLDEWNEYNFHHIKKQRLVMEAYHCSVCDAVILIGGFMLRENDLDNSGMIDSWKPILVLLIVHLCLLSWASGGGAEILW